MNGDIISMIVEFPYIYHAENALGHKAAVTGSIKVDVPVISADDMPIVAHCRTGMRQAIAADLTFRHDGHAFYSSMPSDHGPTISAQEVSEDPVRGRLDMDSLSRLFGHAPRSGEQDRFRSFFISRIAGPGNGMEAFNRPGNMEERREQARVAAGRLVIVDEGLYARCEEPKIVLSLENDMQCPILTVHTGGMEIGTVVDPRYRVHVPASGRCPSFRLDQLADAIERAEAEPVAPMLAVKDIEIRDHAVFGYDPAGPLARNALSAFVKTAAGHLGAADAATVSEFLEFRELAANDPEDAMATLPHLGPRLIPDYFKTPFPSIEKDWERVAKAKAKPDPDGIARPRF